MNLSFRETRLTDIESLFEVRSATRGNRISRAQLAQIGFTLATVAAAIAAGQVVGWVCEHEGRVVGFCSGDTENGEVQVLAVLPEYEGLGAGRQLLGNVVSRLRSCGWETVWLGSYPDPRTRAYGFYRALGWRSSGRHQENGDEILVCSATE